MVRDGSKQPRYAKVEISTCSRDVIISPGSFVRAGGSVLSHGSIDSAELTHAYRRYRWNVILMSSLLRREEGSRARY